MASEQSPKKDLQKEPQQQTQQPQQEQREEEEQTWHSPFPPPTRTPDFLPAHRALTILSMKIASMLLIDLRRTDYAGGSVRGSINVPAQSFWWNRGIVYELAYKADMQWVVFVSGDGRVGGRAWRCAGWFLDYVRDVVGDEAMGVMVLEGGVEGWVGGGEGFWGLMDGFERGGWACLGDGGKA